MNLRRLRAALVTASLTVVVAVPAAAGVDSASAAPVRSSAASHSCTLTSTHKCIRGGEFCPQSKYGKSGYDVKGRRYVCKGNRTHPHWEKP